VLFGVIALFLYVGAEVTVGSMLVNYLGLPRTMRFEPETAGKYLSFYWGGQLVGRLIGVIALRFVLRRGWWQPMRQQLFAW
jgi:FHS family L-fucose permease-like MFS transporter